MKKKETFRTVDILNGFFDTLARVTFRIKKLEGKLEILNLYEKLINEFDDDTAKTTAMFFLLVDYLGLELKEIDGEYKLEQKGK